MYPIVIVLLFLLILILTVHARENKIYSHFGEKTIRVSMDTNDSAAFSSILHTLKFPGLLGMRYDDSTDTTFFIITVNKSSYQLYMEKLKQIPRIEVIQYVTRYVTPRSYDQCIFGRYHLVCWDNWWTNKDWTLPTGMLDYLEIIL